VSDDSVVLCERRGAVAVLTLNDPARRNPYSMKMRQLISRHLESVQDDESVRAVLITGAGGNFCAGGDVSEWGEWTIGQTRTRLEVAGQNARYIALGNKPVVAAVEGFAFGAGLSLACASDYCVASEAAKFSCAFVKMGLVPDTGLFWSLPLRVGMAKAWEMISLGGVVEAAEAARLGLVNATVAPGGAFEAGLEVANRYAALPAVTLRLLKNARIQAASSLDAALLAELNLQPLALGTADHKEAANAFREKRRPTFTGR
jgi:enoyl-CoA hydratase/carnithine racemase